jgi:hypothetical protein
VSGFVHVTGIQVAALTVCDAVYDKGDDREQRLGLIMMALPDSKGRSGLRINLVWARQFRGELSRRCGLWHLDRCRGVWLFKNIQCLGAARTWTFDW